MKDITIDDIIAWIVANRDETEAIDKINSVTYPFTSVYLNRRNQKEYGMDKD